MLMEVTCRCGAVMRGTRSEIIAKVQAHGWTEHHQKLTPAEVRAVGGPSKSIARRSSKARLESLVREVGPRSSPSRSGR